MNSMKTAILIFAYKAPPVQTPASLRLHQLVPHLVTKQIKVVVLTGEHHHPWPKDTALHLPDAVPVYRQSVKDLRNQLDIDIKTERKKSRGRYASRLAKLYHAFPFILFTGDGGRTYIRKGIKKGAELIESENITHLFSSYRPWADHLICYRLKKKYPHLIWIADFRDRASDPVRNDIWWPWLQRQFQRWILKRVDVVTTVSDGLADHFREDHPNVIVARNAMQQLPNGFLTAPSSPHFTLTYTGSIYPKLQSVDLLLATLRQLLNEEHINPAQLRLHYAGKDGEVWEEWTRYHDLAWCSTQHGMLSLQAAKQLQAESQLNILLSWSAENYGGIMTAKLASYMEAGRPIVTLLNGPLDPELHAAVEKTGAGFVYPSTDPQSPDRLRTFLLDAYRTWQFSGALPWRINPNKLEPYTWPVQIEKLLAAVPSLRHTNSIME